MRGVNRSTKKRFNPIKFILFGISLIALCNLLPWKYFEKRLQKGWSDIASFDDAMQYAKQYSRVPKVNSFEKLRELTQKWVGLDVFFILFNLLRLVLAMVLKDILCSFLPFCRPKNKSLGKKLIHTMRSQVHPEAEESDDDMINVGSNVDQDRQDLGPLGGVATSVFERFAKLIFGFIRAVFKKARMYFLFIWYILRMILLAVRAVLAIPRGIIAGFSSGVEKSGFRFSILNIGKQVEKSGIKHVFFDAIAEIFDQSDDEGDQLDVTGLPRNRGTVSDHDDSDDCNICKGGIDSRHALLDQIDGSRKDPNPSAAPSLAPRTPHRERRRVRQPRKLNKHLKELYEWSVDNDPDRDGGH
jgi:hypothetical protein